MKKLFLILMLCTSAFGARFTVTAHHKIHAKGLRRGRALELPRMAAPVVLSIPDTFDLRGKISPILDQGQCGDCYSFGTTSSLTDALMLQGASKGTLSPQYFADYSGDKCEGGWFDVMQWSVAPRGVPTIANYPITNMDQSPQTVKQPVGSSISWAMLGASSGVTPRDIESFMVQYGYPVPVDLAAGAGQFEDYSGGIYDACVANAPVDHIVAIVGWANEGNKFGSSGFLPNGKGYWIVRNSWGTGFGEAGFFRIAMTDARGNKCNSFASDAAVFFLKKHR